MLGTDLFLMFTRRFDQLGVPYMVTGSVATIIYGAARLTNDVDLIAHLDKAAAKQLPIVFPSEEFYCPPTEIIAIEITRARRGHFNLLHIETGFKADVYLHGADPLHAWGLARATRTSIGDASVMVAPPEYVILRKLEYFQEGGSEKHLRDIQTILQTQRSALRKNELDAMIDERGLTAEWARANTARF